MKKIIIALSTLSILSLSVAAYAAFGFKDLPENEWYSAAVMHMSNSGIVNGYPDETFRPNEKVNRAELSVMLLQTLRHLRDPETLCVVNPGITASGRPKLLVNNHYRESQQFLGAIFTADDCGLGNSLDKVWGVDLSANPRTYTLGSTVELSTYPTAKFRAALKEAGFKAICDGELEQSCTQWQLLGKNVPISKLLKLKDFAPLMVRDDCVYCG
ncbi:hypothetical protein CO046_01695 [Candidatus Peregrinibacteria bacterium CG_4_9_14_0_2_um_filter_53_11]|nr:MAG: hypothetical protein CO046_01695 [Candidatus Peregrinibacteria bacterium CG_4_9_14_0_2_um_filter_53_11]